MLTFVGFSVGRTEHFRRSKVGNLDSHVLIDQDAEQRVSSVRIEKESDSLFGFEISMNHSFAVHMLDG